MSQNSPKQWFRLEEQFFNQVDQDLIKRMRADQEAAQTAESIMKVTGITDQALAAEIAATQITPDTLAAFRLAPMVAVAWADDRVEANERYVILKAAKQAGIGDDEPAMDLLKAWTENRPSGELLEAWCDYAKSLSGSLDDAHKSVLRKEIMAQAHAVAEACGGLLGFGSVSPNEKATLAQIEAALS